MLLLDIDEQKVKDFISEAKEKLTKFGDVLKDVTYSFGIVIVKDYKPVNAEDLLHKADITMYAVKKNEKNSIKIEII